MTDFVSTASDPDDRRTPAFGGYRRTHRDERDAAMGMADGGPQTRLGRNVALNQRVGSSLVNAISMLEHYSMTVEFPTRQDR
jgi:hypothetical protein